MGLRERLLYQVKGSRDFGIIGATFSETEVVFELTFERADHRGINQEIKLNSAGGLDAALIPAWPATRIVLLIF